MYFYFNNLIYINFVNLDDDSNNKFGRRDKFQRELEIYRPGSGPLRRSGNTRQDIDDDDKRSMFAGFSRDLDSSKKSDFIPNKHFENPNRKKENFPRNQSKMNGFAADNYSTFNLRRKQQKKTQSFYESPNEWSNDKRSDRPRVNFVNPDDSKCDDDENWRAHKAPKAGNVSKVANVPKTISVPKVVKKIEEKPVPEKSIAPVENIPSISRVNVVPVQNISENVSGHGNRKREEKKVLNNKIISNTVLIEYEKCPPRFRKKFCEKNNVTREEVESYLTNGILLQDDNSKQHGSYQSRTQTLPPRSGKGRFNEPQRHEQVFYRTNSNNQSQPQPLKTETRRVQKSAAHSTESSRRGVEFDVHNKIFNTHQESTTLDSKIKTDTEDNFSIIMKQSVESALLLGNSGTIVSFNIVFFL